eukprot:2952627-Pyramimonas_sp.AAC.1
MLRPGGGGTGPYAHPAACCQQHLRQGVHVHRESEGANRAPFRDPLSDVHNLYSVVVHVDAVQFHDAG